MTTKSLNTTQPKQHLHVMESEGGQRTIMGWKIGKLLGSGGFSWVLEGQKDGKQSALKFTQMYDQNTHVGKYLRQKREISIELEILKKIEHENIIRLYSFRQVVYLTPDGREIPSYCFALEPCHRFDLFDFLYLTGKFTEPLARTIFKQVVAAVKCLHDAGYAHRDLKAQNVLFTDDFKVKLIDFGGAKLMGNKLLTTCKVGTRGHQAPELLLNRPYTKRCDIFSLGVMLFISVTGHPPFKQALITDPWFRPLAKNPPTYRKFWSSHKNDKLSKDLRTVLECTMAYQPLGRDQIDDVLKQPWIQAPDLPNDAYTSMLSDIRHQCTEKLLVGGKKSRSNKFEGMY